MGGDPVGDQALLDVLGVRQPEVLLRRDVAEHRGAVPADDRRADRRRDVVVAGRDVGDERAERVERRLVADLLLAAHVHLELVQRHVARALDHHLHVALPGALRQLAERVELGELRGVAGVGDRARPQPVAERERDVVLAADLEHSSKRS